MFEILIYNLAEYFLLWKYIVLFSLDDSFWSYYIIF